MRLFAPIVVLALLAGCAVSPPQLRAAGVTGHYESAVKPPVIGHCLDRTLRNLSGNVTTHTDVSPGGSIELVAQAGEWGVVAIFDIAPRGDGAIVDAYIARNVAGDKMRQAADDLMRDCYGKAV